MTAFLLLALGDSEPSAWVRALNAVLNSVQLVALAWLVNERRRR